MFDDNVYENNKLTELIDQCHTNSLINLNFEKLNDNDIEIVIHIGLTNNSIIQH